MYVETIVSLGLLIAVIGAYQVRQQWGYSPFYILITFGLLASMMGAVVPSGPINGVGFSNTVTIGLLLVMYLGGKTAYRQSLVGVGLVVLLFCLIQRPLSTIPALEPLLGSLENSMRTIGIGSVRFLFNAGLIYALYHQFASKNRLQAIFLSLFSLTLFDLMWTWMVGMSPTDSLVSLIDLGLSAPLVLWYLSFSWHEANTPPKHPPSPQSTLLKTLDHQLENHTTATLTEFLGAIQEAFPQAQAASLCVLKGDRFVLAAQSGYSDELLGTEFSIGYSLIQYGDAETWQQGEARILAGSAWKNRLQLANTTLDTPTLERLQSTPHYGLAKSNLCLPMVVNQTVVAYLSLDSFSSKEAFSSDTIAQVQPYVRTLLRIIQAHQRHITLLSQTHLSSTLLTLHHNLSSSQSLHQAMEQLLQFTMATFAAQHTMISLVSADLQQLEGKVARGFFEDLIPLGVPKGMGIGWAALEGRKTIRTNDVKNDLRVFDPRNSQRPDVSQLTSPLFSLQGKPLGVLYVCSNHPRMFSEQDVVQLSVIAEIASVFLAYWSEQVGSNPTDLVSS